MSRSPLSASKLLRLEVEIQHRPWRSGLFPPVERGWSREWPWPMGRTEVGFSERRASEDLCTKALRLVLPSASSLPRCPRDDAPGLPARAWTTRSVAALPLVPAEATEDRGQPRPDTGALGSAEPAGPPAEPCAIPRPAACQSAGRAHTFVSPGPGGGSLRSRCRQAGSSRAPVLGV